MSGRHQTVGGVRRARRAGEATMATGPALAAAARAACEPLERRLLLSKARVVDAGEHYRDFSSGTDVGLLRATDHVIVGFAEVSTGRRARLSDALTAKGGPLDGYQLKAKVSGTTGYVFQRTARGLSPAFESLNSAIRGFPAIKYFGPTFIQTSDFSRVIATDRVEVELANGVDPATFFARGYSSYEFLGFGRNAYRVTLRVGGALDTVRVATVLASTQQVTHAEPDFALDVSPAAVPNDPYYGSQFNMARANLPSAWNSTTGSSEVVIAVFDNGVDLTHPDLASNVFVNADEVAGNGVDDDGDGYVDDVSGWDFVGNDNDANPDPQTITSHPPDWHGTAVAGIAAAVGGNGVGVAGAAQHAKILPIRMLAGDQGQVTSGIATVTNLVNAFYYVAGLNPGTLAQVWRGADVVSGSWIASNNGLLSTAITTAASAGRGGLGMPIFLASGNGGISTVQYPASLSRDASGNRRGIFAVGASVNGASIGAETRAPYSQYGAALVVVNAAVFGRLIGWFDRAATLMPG